MPPNTVFPKLQPVGLVGLGFMGQGITACLLAHGFDVIGYDQSAANAARSVENVRETLEDLARRKAMPKSRLRGWKKRLAVVSSLRELKPCRFVIECIKEDLAAKRMLFAELEKLVRPGAIIASNTSSLPISLLQSKRRNPERFIGMHWGEPAQVMRYLEIIPGIQTSPKTAEITEQLGKVCGKEPAVLEKDIRGFLSNRMMYAMLREACHLVEAGIADVETVDRSFRNDMGWWATLCGPFRWMDLTGLPSYADVMGDLFPELCKAETVPKIMKAVVRSGAKGTPNLRGFYRYSRKTAGDWERAWVDFAFDIRALVEKYEKKVKS